MFSEALESLEMSLVVDGDTLPVQLKPGDLIRFERKFDKPMTDLAGENGMRFEELAFLGFAALSRTDRFDGTFDEMLDKLDDIDLTGTTPDPTDATD